MDNGFQFLDIILFAMIAAFLIFRLRNVLGRRDGHEGGYHDRFRSDPEKDKVASPDDSTDDDNVVQLPNDKRSKGRAAGDAAGDAGDDAGEDGEAGENGEVADYDGPDGASDDALGMGLRDLRKAGFGFDPEEFVQGAGMAFEMVLDAFTSGDTATLKNLLSPDVYSNFAKAISDREQAGETLEDTLVDIRSADPVEAWLDGRQAFVTVRFVTDQVNVTRDENDDVVDGNPTEIITITDFWTFARDTKSRDPNWTLVATRSMD